MYTDLKRHFVEGPLEDFEALRVSLAENIFGRSVDLKLATTCAASFYYLHEHVYHSDEVINQKFSSAKHYERDIIRRFQKFIIVRDVANCHKHKVLNKSKPPALISNANQLEECVVATRYEDEQGIYMVSKKAIYATLDDKSEENIFNLLTVARFFWMYEFYFLGYFDEPPTPPVEKTEKPKRRSDSITATQDLRITTAVNTTFKFRFFTCVPSEMNAKGDQTASVKSAIEVRIESPLKEHQQ